MIRIRKDFSKVPKSLYVPSSDDDPNATEESKRTHHARLSVIKEESYKKGIQKIGRSENEDRYKRSDVKESLYKIYQGKCAFCEQRLIDNDTVEHFRPKSKDRNKVSDNDEFGYYWLAFSWDNLLLVCSDCNRAKDDRFKIKKTKVVFEKAGIDEINILSEKYNKIEEPFLIHPEYEDPEPQIYFDRNGVIYPNASNDNAEYTITSCFINRRKLNEARKKEFEDFEKEINILIKYTKDKTKLRIIIEDRIHQFISKKQPFLAFRKFALKKFMREKLKTIYA